MAESADHIPFPNFPSEPLGIGGVIDAGVRFFRATFKSTLGVAAIVSIPYALAVAYMNAMQPSLTESTPPEEALAASMQALYAMPVVYIALMFALGGIFAHQAAVARGAPGGVGFGLAQGLKLMVPYTVLLVLFMILIALGIMLLIVPGLILMLSMSLFSAVPHVEPSRSVWSGLWRSHSLVWGGNWWRTAAVLGVVSIVGVVLSVVIYLVMGISLFVGADSQPGLGGYALDAALNWMLLALFTPLSCAVMLTLYNDLLLRKEGDDLSARLAELEPAETP